MTTTRYDLTVEVEIDDDAEIDEVEMLRVLRLIVQLVRGEQRLQVSSASMARWRDDDDGPFLHPVRRIREGYHDEP